MPARAIPLFLLLVVGGQNDANPWCSSIGPDPTSTRCRASSVLPEQDARPRQTRPTPCAPAPDVPVRAGAGGADGHRGGDRSRVARGCSACTTMCSRASRSVGRGSLVRSRSVASCCGLRRWRPPPAPRSPALRPVRLNATSRRQDADGSDAWTTRSRLIFRRRTFWARRPCVRGDVELDCLTLFEGLVAVALDVGVMNEDVLVSLARDEAVTLLGVEELDGALCQRSCSFLSRAVYLYPLVGPRL